MKEPSPASRHAELRHAELVAFCLSLFDGELVSAGRALTLPPVAAKAHSGKTPPSPAHTTEAPK